MTLKYITDKGVTKINPVWQEEQAQQGKGQTVAHPNLALPFMCSVADVNEMTALHANTANPIVMAPTYTASMEIIKDDSFLEQFKSNTPVNGDGIFKGLTDYFAVHEVPIGLINKLLALSQYSLNIIIDDSGSMGNKTDSRVKSAGSYVKHRCHKAGQKDHDFMTRWEEAEDRLHIFIEMLQFIPTGPITISFLDRSDKITLVRDGKSPAEFAKHAHHQVSQAFNQHPDSLTPTYRALKSAFENAKGPTMHYLFTDGEPSDAKPHEVAKLVLNRRNPAENPLTFITCTNDDAAVGWISKLEEVKDSYVAALDDFHDEKKEVLRAQGPVFPYTRGIWLISHLVASINPDDLDALDENTPLTKKSIDDLLGHVTTDSEFKAYFDANPNARKYLSLFNQFKRTDLVAKDILQPATAANAGANSQAFFGAGIPTALCMSVGDAPPPYSIK